MRRTAAPIVFVILAAPSSPAVAQPRPHEPTAHYYKAEGAQVRVAWSLDRTELPEGESLTATLTVRGATNPHEIVRPDLRKLPPFNDAFQIEDVPGPAAKPKDAAVSFAYRLKPRSRAVTKVPFLDFYYFKPGVDPKDSPSEKSFPKTRADSVKIKVVAAAVVPPRVAIPLDAPDALFEIATGPRLLDGEPFAPSGGTWLLLLLGIPLAALGWFVAWRRVYPDASRLARLRRSRAARRATDAIRKAGRTPDPAGAITAAVLGYLRARFPLPYGAETPGEIGDGLRAAERRAEEVDDVVAFFRRCDEARFSPFSDSGLSLAADAEALVARLEATA